MSKKAPKIAPPIPPPPPGFELDPEDVPLPEGFTMDAADGGMGSDADNPFADVQSGHSSRTRPKLPSIPGMAREYQLGQAEGLGFDTSGTDYGFGTLNAGPLSFSLNPAIGSAINFGHALTNIPRQIYNAGNEFVQNPTSGNAASMITAPITEPLKQVGGMIAAPFKSAYEGSQLAEQGDYEGAAGAAGRSVTQALPIVEGGLSAAETIRRAAPGDLRTTMNRAGRTAGKFANAPNIEAPEIVFQRATGIPHEIVPDALDMAFEHQQRTGTPIESASQLEQAAVADTKVTNNYIENFLAPQNKLVVPGQRLRNYQAQVAAIPDIVREKNLPLYTRTMRRLQAELRQPELTVEQLNRHRSELASKGRTKGAVESATDQSVLTKATDNAWANSVRDGLYDFLDTVGPAHGSLFREANRRIERNMLVRDAMKDIVDKSVLEAGKSRADMLAEVPGKLTSATGITGKSGPAAMGINEAIYDSLQRWVPRRGPLPSNPYRPFVQPAIPATPRQGQLPFNQPIIPTPNPPR